MKKAFTVSKVVGTLVVMSAISFSDAAFAQAWAYERDNASPTQDGRPGEYFFFEGVRAIMNGDYRHAVEMYKIAASWAYKKAEYNLGVIFANGEGGVHQDLPQALAWMMLAAEREDGSNEHKTYLAARERIKKACDPSEIAKAEELVTFLNSTYGDEHALPRAKARWHNVLTSATGSHVGFIGGNLQIGGLSPTPNSNPASSKGGSGKYGTGGNVVSAASLTGGHGVDGSIAYRELRETDNPYDPKFDTGTVTVEEPIPASAKTVAPPATQTGRPAQNY